MPETARLITRWFFRSGICILARTRNGDSAVHRPNYPFYYLNRDTYKITLCPVQHQTQCLLSYPLEAGQADKKAAPTAHLVAFVSPASGTLLFFLPYVFRSLTCSRTESLPASRLFITEFKMEDRLFIKWVADVGGTMVWGGGAKIHI